MVAETGEKEVVSAFAIDGPLGGVGINDEVLLCDGNGSIPPDIPPIGANRQPPHPSEIMIDVSTEDIALDVQTNEESWREQWSLPAPDCSDIDWYGQVKVLHPNGQVGVNLANGKHVTVELKNLCRLLPSTIRDPLYDGSDDEADDDDMMDEDGMYAMGPIGPDGYAMDPNTIFSGVMSGASMGMGPFDPINFIGPGGLPNTVMFGPVPSNLYADYPTVPPAAPESDNSWETTDEEEWASDDAMEEDEDEVNEDKENDKKAYISQSDDGRADVEKKHEGIEASEQADAQPKVDDTTTAQDAMDIDEVNIQLDRSPAVSTVSLPDDDPQPTAGPLGLDSLSVLIPFEVCETAPRDHHFFGEAPAESSRTSMSRINKEHKALRSSLPGECNMRGSQIDQN